MKLHHLRSATFIIESGDNFILIDPMLNDKGTMPPFAFVKHKPIRNPTVDLPANAYGLLDKVTHCLITHCQKKHVDHLDSAGEKFLKQKNIPVVCHENDTDYLKSLGLNVAIDISTWEPISFLDGQLTAVPARHGHGWIHKIMANGVGFYLALNNEPSIYISGDTVFTDQVKRALTELKPDISVVACGYASIDVGKPILMSLEEIIEFIKTAPQLVFANHLEALNHCKMTRSHLKLALEEKGLWHKVMMPDDGESILIPTDCVIR